MEQLTYERLQDNLARLKMTRSAEILDAVLLRAEQEKVSYLTFLDGLLEEEVSAKEGRRITTAMRLASLPHAKTIEEYDFSFHPHLDKKTVMELFDLTFLTKKENVVFLGPPGVGKTHLAIALAVKACSHGFKVYFTTMKTLIDKLKESQSSQKSMRQDIFPSLPRRLICSSSLSHTGMKKALRSLRPIRALPTGRSSSMILLLPRPYWTGCFIIAGSLISRGTATGFREGILQNIRKEVNRCRHRSYYSCKWP